MRCDRVRRIKLHFGCIKRHTGKLRVDLRYHFNGIFFDIRGIVRELRMMLTGGEGV